MPKKGLDGLPESSHLSIVNVSGTASLLAALVLAALTPSAAFAEVTESAEPAAEVLAIVPALPGMEQPSVGEALKGLERLRLSPGRDGLDVTETSRRRPSLDGK
jgi:hypothetical protein